MTRISVYKTDVDHSSAADMVLNVIRRRLPDCDASFDLEDCDNVLRIENKNGPVNESFVKNIFRKYGFQLEKLA